MTWLRLHTDILADPKLMRAARAGAKYLYLTPWLLAFAKQANDGGRLTVGHFAAEARDIAATIPCTTPRAVDGCIRELHDIGVLEQDDDGVFRFARWEPRQSKPSASPERVRERVRSHRARSTVTPPEVGEVGRYSNAHRGHQNGVTVTPPEERRGEEKRGEGAGPTSPAPRKTPIPEEIPELPGSAPGGATPQEILERKEALKAGLRSLEQESAP